MIVRSVVHAALCASFLAFTTSHARAGAEAEGAIRAWLEAIASGDQSRLAEVLAPEFQIMRSNGTGHDKAAYAGGAAARITQVQEISDLVATRHDDLLVVRYKLAVVETVDGREIERKAPRLTVFRRSGANWLVVAHANFARIGP